MTPRVCSLGMTTWTCLVERVKLIVLSWLYLVERVQLVVFCSDFLVESVLEDVCS